ncbi:MAG: hypothetical protein U9Q81_13560 [Pseudomonadota bacterium]|nr:hypothetical protein [Pseudomonadota bacterium]
MQSLSRCCLVLSACAIIAGGCAGPEVAQEPRPAPIAKPVRFESTELGVRLLKTLGEGDEETLVQDPGWLEYVLEIENRSRAPLTVRNVKLLNRDGRYLDSASTYQEITAPPDAASELAGDVATRAAGTAAGQVIPYGGHIVSLITGAASISAAEAKTNAQRDFALRKLKNVELAPAGRVKGSAYLPNIQNRKALVIDYGHGDRSERIELPLSSS